MEGESGQWWLETRSRTISDYTYVVIVIVTVVVLHDKRVGR